MGLDNTMPERAESEEQTTSGEQRKSLVANTYSTSSDNNYKDITSWSMEEEEVRLGYELCAPQGGNASVQNALDNLYAGGHEEFYSRLQIALGHVFARSGVVPEFDQRDIESQGSVPVLDLLHIEGSDIVEYVSESDVELTADNIASILDQNPDVAEELFSVMQEADYGDAEAPEADD